jgi:hypothetical protein
MYTRILTHHPKTILLLACAALALLLSACQPANDSTSLPPVQPAATTLPAQPPAATQPPATSSGEITLDLSGVAQDQTVETIAAVPASADAPWWAAMPEYRRVTLQGYPVTSHLLQPQIFVYPVADLAAYNEVAGQVAADLQAQLQTRQPVDHLPFLPAFNAAQVMHVQDTYLDFQNGSGVRFLTQYDQGVLPINNYELIYTFQGLTSDGQYYIAAVLPVTHPELPATDQVSTQQIAELSDFPAYRMKIVSWLEQQPSSSFTPDLAKLDTLIQSIAVK